MRLVSWLSVIGFVWVGVGGSVSAQNKATLESSGSGASATWKWTGASTVTTEGQLCIAANAALPSDCKKVGALKRDASGTWQPASSAGAKRQWEIAEVTSSGSCFGFITTGDVGQYTFGCVDDGNATPFSNEGVTVQGATATGGQPADKLTSDTEVLNTQARAWLDANGKKDHVDHEGWGTVHGTAELYFLPDGTAANLLPDNLTERDEITIHVIVPKDSKKASLTLNTCAAREVPHVSGDFTSAKNPAQKAEPGKAEAPAMMDVKLGPFHCGSGQASFTIVTDSTSTQTTISLSPVYDATFGLQFTFDFTPSGKLGTSTNAAGETVITRDHDVQGPKIVPTFSIHLFGQSSTQLTVLSVALNPTFGFDLSHITSSFFVGDNVCFSWFCLSSGIHLRQTEQLDPASGLSVGNKFDPTKGPLPVKPHWTTKDGGLGLYIGATVDLRVAAQLIGGK